MFRRRNQQRNRRGATVVEAALVLPVFLVFIYGIIEIAHMIAINTILQNGVRDAARLGSTPGVTNSQAIGRLQEYVGAMVPASELTVDIKDASNYDDGTLDIRDDSAFDTMNDIQLENAETQTLFGVRAQVNFNDVAFIPWPFTEDVTLRGVIFMRHE